MNVVRFLANGAADAVDQIRSRLGPDAVVLTVTQVPAEGVRRFWGKRRLEVLACLPEASAGHPPADPLQPPGHRRAGALFLNPVAEVRIPGPDPGVSTPPVTGGGFDAYDEDASANNRQKTIGADAGPPAPDGKWRSAVVLHQMGLQPLHVEKVLDRARSSYGDTPPASFAQEIALVRSVLASFWRAAPRAVSSPSPLHVFIGSPGSGKTTALCKWLAKSVLAEGRRARAWRLDSRAAHLAGALDLYSEILGVPVERELNAAQPLTGFDIGFVDLPGIDPQDVTAVRQLRARLEAMPSAQVHLVLNAAYDVSVTLAQVRAFAALPVNDLVFTHLDEEKRRGKLWNFVLGTNFSIRLLSGGQNIPGNFSVATPGLLFPQQIRSEIEGAAILHGERRLGKRPADNEQRISVG